MPSSRRGAALLALALTFGLLFAAVSARPASASRGQLAMIEDDGHLSSDPAGTLAQMRLLGAGVVRVFLPWYRIAPEGTSFQRPGFNAADPRAYPQGNWALYDTIVRDAQVDGMSVDFVLTGPAPYWALGSNQPAGSNPQWSWEPSPSEYALWVRAVGSRYSGHFPPNGSNTPLPRVRYWEIWNEPNFGEDLAPQAINGSRVSVAEANYRALLQGAWISLQGTGHGRDAIQIGQLAARGTSGGPTPKAPEGYPGTYGQTKPLQFVRTLYCLDSHFKPLRGTLAASEGCPTTASASRGFRAQNPGLFNASGFGIHPYPQGLPPTTDASRDPDFVTFNKIPELERTLDRALSAYGSGRHLAIYNNEYGYITNPPTLGHQFASPELAAEYSNWAEYLSYKDPRMAVTMQYLLVDVNPRYSPSLFNSGLIFSSGRPKPGYYDYRMPLFLPVTSARRGTALEVWGAARPAPYARHDTRRGQTVMIQFARGSSNRFRTVQTFVDNDAHGYFDRRVRFPGSGTVRIAWSYPTSYTKLLSYLNPLARSRTAYSRTVRIRLR